MPGGIKHGSGLGVAVQKAQSSLSSAGLLLCLANQTGLGPLVTEGTAQAQSLPLA